MPAAAGVGEQSGAGVQPAGAQCPECGAVCDQLHGAICQICGFNFQTGSGGAPAAPARQIVADHSWNVIASVDADLFGGHEANAPVDQPAQVFTLFEAVNIIGRSDPETRIHVPITMDHAVSRHQAVLTRQPDGSLAVRDLGSANGTFLNGIMLTPGVETAVKDGDVIGVGAWTRIEVRQRPP
jgi:pSer/pThr/pTyr-binding forkhead associated (FHA) protein